MERERAGERGWRRGKGGGNLTPREKLIGQQKPQCYDSKGEMGREEERAVCRYIE